MGHSLPVPLSQLNPEWLDRDWAEPPRTGIGIEFDCPHCQERAKIFFKNPLDGGPQRGPAEICHWTVVSGKSFQDLTLVPSIKWDGHFHGNIANGVLYQA